MPTYYVDPAATGLNNGSSWTDAWTSFQTAADTAVAGDTVYCRGTQTLSAPIDIDTNDGDPTSGPIVFVGVNSGGTEDGTRFTLDGNATASACLLCTAKGAQTEWRNFAFTNATNYGAQIAGGSVYKTKWINCGFNSNGTLAGHHGLRASNYLDGGFFLQCEFNGNSDNGLFQVQQCSFVGCQFIGNGQEGCTNCTFNLYYGCLFHNNGRSGVVPDNSVVLNCVIDGNGTAGTYNGVSIDGIYSLTIGCRITNNTGYGIGNWDAAALGHEDFNFIASNTSGPRENAQVSVGANSVTSGTEGYNDRASDDFNLTASATLRHAELDIDGTNKHFLSAGLHPDEPAGGGGGVARLIGSGGGLIGE